MYILALPYKRDFNRGHQSELLYNEELHKQYRSTKHLLDIPEGKNSTPQGVLDGELWLKRPNDELKTYHRKTNTWHNIFASKFQITDEIMNIYPPANPIPGQLWIYNDVLLYYSGTGWRPIKALEEPDSQFSLGLFENFYMASPLWSDSRIKAEHARHKLYKRMYDFEKLNEITGSQFLEGDKYYISKHDCDIDEVTEEDMETTGIFQMLVPNIDVDRLFLDHDIDFNYEELTKVCITYPKEYIIDKITSLIHINPGKLTNIKKRLFRFDRDNPIIKKSAVDTEFYGFHADNPDGDLLLPRHVNELDDVESGDYEAVTEGIYLSYDAAHNYDYILAITYEFSWIKSTGRLNVASNREQKISYYIQDYTAPMNVFVQGYNLDEPSYEDDNIAQTVTIKDKTEDLDVSFMSSIKREYGFVRRIDLQGRAVIRTIRNYRQPLIFMNGEALHPALDNIIFDKDNYIYVPNGRINMSWAVIELYDEHAIYMKAEQAESLDESTIDTLISTGFIQFKKDNTTGKYVPEDKYAGYIVYQKKDDDHPNGVEDSDSLILFVDGMLIKKEDIRRDYDNSIITVDGLKAGQSCILIQDSKNRLYDETSIRPALSVGTMSESLVYRNGKLLCNETAIIDNYTREALSEPTKLSQFIHNEIKCLLPADGGERLELLDGDYCYYDETTDSWLDIDGNDIPKIRRIVDSYVNTPRSIEYHFTPKVTDDIHVFGFNYANAIENYLVIRNVPYSMIDYELYLAKYNEAKENKDTVAMATYKEQLEKITYGYDECREAYEQAVFNGDPTEISLAKEKLDLVTYVKDGKVVPRPMIIDVPETYVPSENSLSVYVNGVRQYEIKTHSDGLAFELPKYVSGIVTYVIEPPEKGADKTAERQILTDKDIIPGTINAYRTTIPMYPGRVVLYIDGVRQPRDAFTVMDNYTLLINGDKKLIGNADNYPIEPYVTTAGTRYIHHKNPDRILVEVKQDYERTEVNLELTDDTSSSIKLSQYDELPANILESADEISIFLNGLFLGLREHEGYTKDISYGAIRLTSPDTIDRIVSDPLQTYLMSHPDARNRYKMTHHDKDYVPPKKTMILEWR